MVCHICNQTEYNVHVHYHLFLGLVSVLSYIFVSCKLCVAYTLLTGDLLSGLVSVLCYMFVSCMLCSLATCFRVL